MYNKAETGKRNGLDVEGLKEPKEIHVTNFCQGYAENISFIPPRGFEWKAVEPEENIDQQGYANRIGVQQFETPLTRVNKITPVRSNLRAPYALFDSSSDRSFTPEKAPVAPRHPILRLTQLRRLATTETPQVRRTRFI
jgi:hypothetical protein